MKPKSQMPPETKPFREESESSAAQSEDEKQSSLSMPSTRGTLRPTLRQFISQHGVFISATSACAAIVLLLSLRDPNAIVSRYREVMLEEKRQEEQERTEHVDAFSRSQQELVATQKALVETQAALTANINALRRVEAALSRATDSVSTPAPIVVSSIAPRRDDRASMMQSLVNLASQCAMARRAELNNLSTLTDNVRYLASAERDLAIENDAIRILKGGALSNIPEKQVRTWESFIPPRFSYLFSHKAGASPTPAGDTATESALNGLPEMRAKLVLLANSLSDTEERLSNTEADIRDVQSEIHSTQEKITSARAEIVILQNEALNRK